MKNVFIRCPRCELNYILKKDKLCPVCKEELGTLHTNYCEDGEGATKMGLCPICKINYIDSEEETVCATCLSEGDLDDTEIAKIYGGEEDEDDDLSDAEDLEIVEAGDGDEELEIIGVEEGEDELEDEDLDEEDEEELEDLDDDEDEEDEDEEDEDLDEEDDDE
ncbi:MAG: hypothetical protein FWD32_00625 [Firmicutes bacterium]|nr:hypothetical protein [Bacillota bacterium]